MEISSQITKGPHHSKVRDCTDILRQASSLPPSKGPSCGGAIHVHAIVRIDAAPPECDPNAVAAPPAEFTIEHLEASIRCLVALRGLGLPEPRRGVDGELGHVMAAGARRHDADPTSMWRQGARLGRWPIVAPRCLDPTAHGREGSGKKPTLTADRIRSRTAPRPRPVVSRTFRYLRSFAWRRVFGWLWRKHREASKWRAGCAEKRTSGRSAVRGDGSVERLAPRPGPTLQDGPELGSYTCLK
jgi:hypothetical protein